MHSESLLLILDPFVFPPTVSMMTVFPLLAYSPQSEAVGMRKPTLSQFLGVGGGSFLLQSVQLGRGP